MGEKYQIDIGISSKASPGKTKSGGMQEVAEQVASARRAMEFGKDPNKKGSYDKKVERQTMSMDSLQKTIPNLARTMQKLEQTIGKQTTVQRSSHAHQVTMGQKMQRVLGGGGGGGLGLGKIGGAIPFLGAALAATGFIVSKVLDIGRNYLSLASQQIGTSGVGGFYNMGGYGYFNAGQMGQLGKTMRTAGGGLIRPEDYGVNARGQGTGFYARMRGFGAGAGGAAIGMAKMFGMGAQELGQPAGLLDLFSGEKGMEALGKIVGQYGRRSGAMTSEIPFLISTIQSTLEEAVREGINDSDLAEDMAKEISTMSRYIPNQQYRGAVAVQQDLMGAQSQLARGHGFGGLVGFRMFEAGRKYLRGGLMGGGKMADMFVNRGLMSKEDIEQFRAGKGMDPYTEQFLTQYLMQQRKGAIRNMFMSDMVKTFSRGQGSESQKMGRFSSVVQSLGWNLTPIQTAAIWQQFRGKQRIGDLEGQRKELYGQIAKRLGIQTGDVEKMGRGAMQKMVDTGQLPGYAVQRVDDINRQLADAKSRFREKDPLEGEKPQDRVKATKQLIDDILTKVGEGFRAQGQIIEKERLMLGTSAAKAGDAVIKFENSMISLADKSMPVVNKAIDVTTELLGAFGGALNSVAAEIQKILSQGYIDMGLLGKLWVNPSKKYTTAVQNLGTKDQPIFIPGQK